MKLSHLLLLLLLFCGSTLTAQVTPGQVSEAKSELKRRGVDEGELQARLKQRGIDVASMSPIELAEVRPEIEAVIAEMEAENRRASNGESLPPAPSAIDLQQDLPDAEAVKEEDKDIVQERVIDALQKEVAPSKIWGHQLFRNQSLEVYKTTDNVKPPDTYRIGVGDEVAVSIFGASQADLKFIVDAEGFVRPPGMPRIYLRGVSLGKARELVESRFSEYYTFRRGQFTFNIDAARTITVNIFGETEQNGSFTISAVNTIFNALVAAGGPTDEGSVRKIKLLREGKEIFVDVYSFLLDPTRSVDLYLEDNDVIFVPFSETVVQVEGAVKRPLFYELLPDERLEDVIRLAGGLIPQAAPASVTVSSTRDGMIKVQNVDLTSAAGKGFELQSSSVINVPTISSPIKDYVTISGDVALPGRYAYEPEMTAGKLIQRGALKASSRQDAAFIRRKSPVDSTAELIQFSIYEILANKTTDLKLEQGDELIILSSVTYARPATISVSGAVKNPVENYTYSIEGNIKVETALLLAGGLEDNASDVAFLIRQNPANTSQKQYVQLDLSKAEDLNRSLRPFDNLTIYTSERFSEPFSVTINGAVRENGTFTYDPSLGLKDLFALAGGLRPEAALNKIEVFRLDIMQNEATKTLTTTLEIDEKYDIVTSSEPNFQLKPYDVVMVRKVPEYEMIKTITIGGEVRYPGIYALDKDNMRMTDLIDRAGGLTAEAFLPGASMQRELGNTGTVVVRLDEAIESPNSASNLTLKEGDQLIIPKALDLVAIAPPNTRASLAYDISYFEDGTLDVGFQGKHSAKWYINRYAAGFSEDALRRSLTVQYANGELGKTKKFLFFNFYPEIRPGSTIRILSAKEPKAPKKERAEPVDWAAITQATLGGITTFLTLYLLLERTN